MSLGRIPSVEGGIQPTIMDAKGDLLAATAADTPARLAVGNNGETLLADSSTTTGLRWQGQFMAGKNKIINGDCFWNQRNFSSNARTTAGLDYIVDRFFGYHSGNGTSTFSVQQFSPGTAPVTGYEAKQYMRAVTASQSNANSATFLAQSIEDVRTFANQTVTISFWAKCNTGTPKIAVEIEQGFGTGGSPSSSVYTYAGQVTLSTSWTRYSLTVSMPSISGKTLGTDANSSKLLVTLWTSAGTDFNSRTGSLGIQSNTFDFWGVQVEAGSVATPFTTATGTIQGELAACQRYYYRFTIADGNDFSAGFNTSTTKHLGFMTFPVSMRIAPTALEQSGTASHYKVRHGATATNASVVPSFEAATIGGATIGLTVASGLTAGQGSMGASNNNSAYLGWSAEL